jgi:hypothetical protein
VGARPERLAWSPSSGWSRRSVGPWGWLLLYVFASVSSVTAARPGDTPPSRLPGLQARTPAPRLVLNWHDGRLSVSAHAASWEEVLQELERHTEVKIRVQGQLTGTLTHAFAALPLEQGLRRLFRDVNTVFFYVMGPDAGAATASLTQVWLVPRDEGSAARPPPSPGESVAAMPLGGADPLWESTVRSPPPEEIPSVDAEDEEATLPERR